MQSTSFSSCGFPSAMLGYFVIRGDEDYDDFNQGALCPKYFN